MKFTKFLMASAGAATMLFAHGSEPAADQLTKTTDSMNSVIIYFTHSGNTELTAKELSKATGAKAIRLIPEQPYSSADVDWTMRPPDAHASISTNRYVRRLSLSTLISPKSIRYFWVSRSGGTRSRP